MKEVNHNHTPLYREAGFRFADATACKQAFIDEKAHPHEPKQYIYSRYRNPSVVATEKQLMNLEQCDWALLVETGMAAIDVAVSIFQDKDDARPFLFFHEIYGGSNSFIDSVLIQRRGMNIARFYADNGRYDYDALEKMLQDLNPAFMYFEAVSNPMLIVADVKRILNLAKKYNVKTIIDNTFATPYLWKPLQDGADLVIHSATKYLSGHGNITAGAICGNDKDLMQAAIEYRKWTGHFLSPDDAYRLGTQLKTFNLRFQQHCKNALAIAKMLKNHPKISVCLYPGLESHESHQAAKSLFGDKGFGGMICFELAGKDHAEKEKKRNAFMAALQNDISLVPTLGEADSILLPVEPVWGAKYPLPGYIRLSVGIEETKVLIEKITQALNKL